MPQRAALSIHQFRPHLFPLNWYENSFLTLGLIDLFNRKAMCFGPRFILGVLFFFLRRERRKI